MTVTAHNCKLTQNKQLPFKTHPISSLRVHRALRAMILLLGFAIKPSSQPHHLAGEQRIGEKGSSGPLKVPSNYAPFRRILAIFDTPLCREDLLLTDPVFMSFSQLSMAPVAKDGLKPTDVWYQAPA